MSMRKKVLHQIKQNLREAARKGVKKYSRPLDIESLENQSVNQLISQSVDRSVSGPVN